MPNCENCGGSWNLKEYPRHYTPGQIWEGGETQSLCEICAHLPVEALKGQGVAALIEKFIPVIHRIVRYELARALILQITVPFKDVRNSILDTHDLDFEEDKKEESHG